MYFLLYTPKTGTLAALLDKKASDAGDYASFCPDAVLNKGRCAEHAAPEAIWFDDAPAGSTIVRQTLPLQPLWLDDEDPWPLASLRCSLRP